MPTAAVPVSRNKYRLNNVQALRFFAAAAVLVGHTQHEAGVKLFPDWFYTGFGVDVFFVISGLIMYLQSHDHFGEPGYAKKFFIRRFERIAPIYWIFSALMLLSMVALKQYVAKNQIEIGHVISSFLFFPWLNEVGRFRPILGLGWTLNYEMFFYTVFTVCLLFRKGVYALLAAFVGFAVVGALAPDSYWPLKFWGQPIIFEFLFGIGLAALLLRGGKMNLLSAVVLAIGGICALFIARYVGVEDETWRVLWAGAPAFAVTMAFVLTPQINGDGRIAAALILAGDASYALYLSHPFSINLVLIAFKKLHVASPLLAITAASITAIVVSVGVHLFLEKPLLSMLHRWSSPDRGKRMSPKQVEAK
jgi:peptidoglycan/LPS O-acetylase OafA/YrhL